MEVERIIYLDEEDLENINRIRNILYILGLDFLYGEASLLPVAYEISFNSVFDEVIKELHKNSKSSGYKTESERMLFINTPNGNIEFEFYNNRIKIQGHNFKNSDPAYPDLTEISINFWENPEKLYYDSKVTEYFSQRSYIKKTKHIVRSQGKTLFISKPVYEVKEEKIPVLKRQKGKLNESLLY